MNDEDTVEPQEDQIEQEVEQQEVVSEVAQDESHVSQEKQTHVPLSALQKERKKRQELEQELQWERRRQQVAAQPAPPQEEDNSKYESATREDLSRSQEEAVRIIEEKLWIKQNPEKYEKINEYLPQFLKQRPNLVTAINTAQNRYEEAYTLMEALTPKQQQQMKAQPKPKVEAPGAPTSVPKAAAMNQTVDVMSMNDAEFSAWKQSQKRRR